MTESTGVRVDLTFDDIDEYELSPTPEDWDLRFLQLSAGKFWSRYRALTLPGLYVTQVDYGRTSLAISGNASRAMQPIILPLHIGRHLQYRGETVASTQGVFVSPRDQVDFLLRDGVIFAGIYLPRETALAIQRSAYGPETAVPENAWQHSLVAGPSIEILKQIARELFQYDSCLATRRLSSQHASNLARDIGSLLIASLSNGAGQPAGRQGARQHRRHLHARRARDIMQAHLDAALPLPEICRELGISARTLHYTFRHYYGETPARYHLKMRLQAARRELKTSHPAETSVTRIATNWGFWHFGHFSQVYRSQFGELPSQALAQQPVKIQVPRSGLLDVRHSAAVDAC